jgi:hypothetical protein
MWITAVPQLKPWYSERDTWWKVVNCGLISSVDPKCLLKSLQSRAYIMTNPRETRGSPLGVKPRPDLPRVQLIKERSGG